MTKIITNKFAGTCSECGTDVAAGAGIATAELVKGQKAKWTVTCRPCHTGEPTPVEQDAPIAERPTFMLTDEQQAVVDAVKTGESVAVQAGAGTGKTSTLVAIAKATGRTWHYVAFNKAIVREASRKMPANTICSTMSSLAFHQVGKVHYLARLDDDTRVPSSQLAKRIGVEPFYFAHGTEQHVLQPGRLTSAVFTALGKFCMSDDAEPGAQHFEYMNGLDLPDDEGNRTYATNDKVRAHLLPALRKVWADFKDPQGTLVNGTRFTLSVIEKIWERGLHGAPVIPGDGILFDEAQDANPVYLSVIAQQAKPVVWVGDSQQQIYEWRGAVNALANVPAESTCYLTHSFRFGPEIAAVANKVLATIQSAQLRLVGRGQPGTTGTTEEADAILTRTNAGAIGIVLDNIATGRKVHLVGGGGEVERFAKAARQLMTTGRTEHPDLACFTSWAQVQEYVQHDSDGADLKLMVKLIDDFGVEAILSAVANTYSEAEADVIVSTAHKAKGQEWDSVKLGPDFKGLETDGEKRLLYVAVTRAMRHLDYSACPALTELMGNTETQGEEQ